ncbi:aldehyde ferredoxin oxidoreductase N-terminal domain-containing protein [Thermodesulfobacteriota bacterium]
MTHNGGYAGNILRVNLSNGSIDRVPTENYSEQFLGGRGIAAKLYWDEVPPEVDAFDPENRLIFTTGPVTATTGFAGSRWQVCGKSPLHQQFSYCNLGGAWGAQLKLSGYDALVVHGKAAESVYLWIGDDKVEIRSAVDLAGKGAIACREELKARLGKAVRVVAIGPAGENGVVFANLIADSDSSGSGGLAAAMGAKNLKAITVRGKLKPDVADPDKIQELKKQFLSRMAGLDDEFYLDAVPHFGVVSPKKLKKEICYGCTGENCIRKNYTGQSGKRGKFMCGSSFFYIIRAQRYYGEGNDVPFEAAKICDDYGLDTHAIEPMIMWLVRCHKAGLLSDEQAGIPISKSGSLEFIETLARKIALREGFGDALAEGTLKAAESLGEAARRLITDYVSRDGHIPFYGARMYVTTGLIYAMEPRLAIQQLHEISTLVMKIAYNQDPKSGGVTPEVVRAIAKRFWGSEIAGDFSTNEGKALAAAKIQDRQHAKESLILCDFTWPVMYSPLTEEHVGDPTLESQLCSAVTGNPIDETGLYKIGERVFNLQRAILAREGHRGREYDTLDEFEYTVPLKNDIGNPECLVPGKDGEVFSRKGMVVDRSEFEKMKDEYYELRGWDLETGLQRKAQLEELGLDEVAETLSQEGLLADK